jgi:hypothetical protein
MTLVTRIREENTDYVSRVYPTKHLGLGDEGWVDLMRVSG